MASNVKSGRSVEAPGLRGAGLQSKLDDLEARRAALEAQLANPTPPPPRLIGNLSAIYRQKVADLATLLGDPQESRASLEIVRGLIDKIEVSPGQAGGAPVIMLTGELAAMLRLGLGEGDPERRIAARETALAASGSDMFCGSVKVVAGTGFEPVTFRL